MYAINACNRWQRLFTQSAFLSRSKSNDDVMLVDRTEQFVYLRVYTDKQSVKRRWKKLRCIGVYVWKAGSLESVHDYGIIGKLCSGTCIAENPLTFSGPFNAPQYTLHRFTSITGRQCGESGEILTGELKDPLILWKSFLIPLSSASRSELYATRISMQIERRGRICSGCPSVYILQIWNQ